MRELHHVNIVRYYDRIIDKAETRIYIVMEYCASRDLASIIKSSRENRSPLHEDWIWKVFTQIVMALHACHIRPEGKILHRDLKSANVFLYSEDTSTEVAKLGDLNVSKVAKQGLLYTQTGTPYYASPEVWKD